MADDEEQLSPEVAALLVRLRRGWLPDPPMLAEPVEARWGRLTVPGAAVSIDTANQDPEVILRLPGLDPRRMPQLMRASQPLKVRLSDGTVFEQSEALVREVSYRVTPSGQAAVVSFHRTQWRWYRGNEDDPRAPIAWVTTLPGLTDVEPTIGNARVRARYQRAGVAEASREVLHTFCALHGLFNYFLVGRDGPGLTCVIASKGVPEEWVWFDRVLLSFVLGRRVGLAPLIGVDHAGRTVGTLSESLRGSSNASSRERLPSDGLWFVEFHDRLAALLRDDPRGPLMSAIGMFIDGFDDSLPGEFLKSHSALVSAVRTTQPAVSAIATPDRQPLPPYGPEAAALGVLYGDAVPRPALIAVAEDPVRSIKDMDIPTFEGFALVETVGSLFVSLLASACGYEGPLLGFVQKVPLPWWSGRAATPHARVLRGTVTVEEPLLPRDLWPKFSVPEPSSNVLVQAMIGFASDLSHRSRGAVAALFEAQPAERGRRRYDFKIFPRRMPTVQTVVFSAAEVSGGLLVDGWADEDIKLSSLADLHSFASEVAESETIRVAIERYMLLDLQATQGAR